MSISNPSHLLISRNPPRSPAHPQLAHGHHGPSSPLPSPRQGFLGRWHHSAEELPSSSTHQRNISMSDSASGSNLEEDVDFQENDQDLIIVIHPTFQKDTLMPGRVKVVVGRNEFWCHKEVLWFASPFFQGLLQGNWTENNPLTNPTTPSPYAIDLSPAHSVVTPSSPPTDTDPPSPRFGSSPGPLEVESSSTPQTSKAKSVTPASHSIDQSQSTTSSKGAGGGDTQLNEDTRLDDPSVSDILKELRESPESPDSIRAISDVLESTIPPALSELAVGSSKLNIQSTPSSTDNLLPLSPTDSVETTLPISSNYVSRRMGRSRTRSTIRHSFSSGSVGGQARLGRVEAVVELHEESPAAFHDFLFWAYPHLECKVTWTNVENLLALSLKLLVPALQKLCEHFLMSHASGRPVMALCLAEEHGNADLYREASRFVLDQPSWDQSEIECLSADTRIRLSSRRNWFLERLLKLGSIDVKKEYTCRADCPDPTRCQSQLDEKWRQAHSAVCRYGPPQPSVAFRCLRQLETFPTNPSLVMPHPLCQTTAKTWVMSLFDRMFQPKLVFSNPGTEKYWLWITMN
ncbi:uncharacterized protein IL334_007208 [Kwoniella shivajii]|uniref:BTB domain-containing protein n=1 Tax=Kwoniella shivajii TaxID=564305 RepID=A0ABZ1D8U4_9TREE|nr:hypothetical protein IL334_007208 [Kwoniella shivajii]